MMDSDEVYALADGRQIHLDWIRVSRTFLGFMVGLPQACSTHIREELRQKAELRGWQVIDMHGEILPRFQCIASLTSYECVRSGDYSYLDVFWFVDSLDVSLRGFVADVLPHVDWDHRALDGSWDDM